jgi:hypothetical protein
MDKNPQAETATPAAVSDDIVVVTVYEETQATYWVARKRFTDLELPNGRPEIDDSYDEEHTMAALEGLAPVEFAVTERQISFPTNA